MLDSFFKISERKSTIRTEIIAGFAVFLSMAYIMAVNPAILSDAGMNRDAVFVATIFGSIIGTLISGLYANYPVAQAPGMGLNAFFAYTFCGILGFTWQEGLFTVFLAGLIFLAMSFGGIREIIINAIPNSIKYSISVGIGGFIAFIGLKEAGIIVQNPATFVTIGNFTDTSVILTIIGVVVILILMARKVSIAIFLGMVSVAIISVLFGVTKLPPSVVAPIPDFSSVFMAAFTVNKTALFTNPLFYFGILSFLMCNFFDTAGTLISIGSAAGMLSKEGKLIGGNKALIADATSTVAGACVGTSPVTSYVESMVGVELGGRTGMVSVVVAVCFFLSLFFSPLLDIITPAVTSPALIIVGSLMFGNAAKIDFDDLASKMSAFFTVMFMILSYSITNGIGMGFITYSIIMLGEGKGKKVHPVIYVIASLFVLYFVFLNWNFGK